MASGGIDKFKKYFAGKTVKTTVKQDSFIFDINNPSKKVVPIKAGTDIMVLPKKKFEDYDKKYLVEAKINGKKVSGLMVDGAVAKPIAQKGSSAKDLRLKPQYLGLEEKPQGYPLRDVINNVRKALQDREDMPDVVKEYMIYLIEQVGKDPKKTVKFNDKLFNKISDGEMNQVKKDFGEIVGAIAIVADRTLFKSLKIDGKSTIFYPTRGNEPLMDFRILTKSGAKDFKYIFSAKTGTTTNTLKPVDILKLIEGDSKLLTKWKNTLEYKILEILNANSILRGPLEVLDMLNKKYPKYKYKKSVSGLLEDEKDSKKRNASSFVSEVYQAEKHVVDLSKTLKYTEMFFDAIIGRVYYINLSSLDPKWLPIWKTEGESSSQNHAKAKTVAFRSKNSNNRMKDKLGLQM